MENFKFQSVSIQRTEILCGDIKNCGQVFNIYKGFEDQL